MCLKLSRTAEAAPLILLLMMSRNHRGRVRFTLKWSHENPNKLPTADHCPRQLSVVLGFLRYFWNIFQFGLLQGVKWCSRNSLLFIFKCYQMLVEIDTCLLYTEQGQNSFVAISKVQMGAEKQGTWTFSAGKCFSRFHTWKKIRVEEGHRLVKKGIRRR